MNKGDHQLLQLCPLSPFLEAELAVRARVVRWFDLSSDARSKWLANNAESARIIVTGGHVGCPSDLMEALPRLGIVAINGVGFDKVDLACASGRAIRVTNTPDVLTEDVADLAVGLIISVKRGIPAADRFVREGNWGSGDTLLGRKVSGSRFGIVGLGRIGRAIATRLSPFGEVAYAAQSDKQNTCLYFETVRELALWSNVLVIACAATPATYQLVDTEVLDALGNDGYLVNVARGSVVDENAVAQALTDGRLAGAALDVFAREPEVPSSLLLQDRTVLTPHIASATAETREAMANLVLANIDAFIDGEELVTPVV